jgi:xanthine dehydrogenase YagR molybdenum-binding subunit
MPFVGQPLDRVDGPLKVTGKAVYAYEQWAAGQPLYGHILGSSIGRGRILSIDTSRAERSPGVRHVMTYRNTPYEAAANLREPDPYARAEPMLKGDAIRSHGEPVALVIATTLEEARAAANLVVVDYAPEAGQFDLASRLHSSYAPKKVRGMWDAATAHGDFQSAFDGADVRHDADYATPYEFSQPLELHCCLASWRGDDVTVYVSGQIVAYARVAISKTLGIDPKRIHVVSTFVGGGFGSKLGIHAETILAVMAARAVKAPVKVGLTRQQLFQLVGMRPASHQRVRLGARQDGGLVAIAHEVNMHTSRHVEIVEQTAITTRSLYAASNRLTAHRLTKLDLQPGEDVRAPGEAPGLLAVESAMDELAHTLGIDPIELRIRNEPTVDPERGVPYSDRHLVECMREGAKRFGWERRVAKPASTRDGRWLIGHGMAAGIRMHFQAPTTMRVRMGADGMAVVQSDMTDIGTGTYTILTQVAADALELPLERVCVELGRSEFPESGGSGGSFGATNSTNALHRACLALRAKLDANGGTVPPEGIVAEGEVAGMETDPQFKAYSIHTYGAHFVEVGVDADTAEVRLRRMLGVFSAGRILNAKTARSQLIGGMIWGVSAALHEDGVVDTRSGAFVNRDLASYLVPVHADIPSVDAILLDAPDERANPLGVKGVGELGICGSGAAVANAVFNATGVRVREFPITIEKILPGLPPLEA